MKPPRSTGTKNCPHCGTVTIPANRHRRMPRDQREGIRARQWTDGTCNLCAKRINAGKAAAYTPAERLAYEGGWVNRGGVMYPTAPARPTGRPPKPLIMPPADRYAGYAAYRRGDRSQWAIQGYREYQRHDQRLRRARKKAA